MKKYLFGIMAIALAIGFSAFNKKPVKKSTDTLLLFEYIGPTTYSTTNVQAKGNWQFVREFDEADCSADIKPCQIQVSSDEVDGYPGVAPALKANISATVSSDKSTPIATGAVLEAFNLEVQ